MVFFRTSEFSATILPKLRSLIGEMQHNPAAYTAMCRVKDLHLKPAGAAIQAFGHAFEDCNEVFPHGAEAAHCENFLKSGAGSKLACECRPFFLVSRWFWKSSSVG